MPLTRRESLSLFPEAILWDVVEDDQFRDVLGVKLDGVIVFDGDKARFGRATFFDAIREHVGADKLAEIDLTLYSSQQAAGTG